MEQFSIERAKQGGIIQTRCGFKVNNINFNSGIAELPIAATVMEVVTEMVRRKKVTRIEPCLTLYHADGRLYDDKDDDFDLVIEEQ